MERTFATPELLELILLCLLDRILPLTDQEDPRSVKTHGNATKLLHLLRCSQVSHAWQQCMAGSKRLQRALFLVPDDKLLRSWSHNNSAQSEQIRLRSYYRAPTLRAPILNPIIQVTFPSYHFRFWHLSLEASGNKHCAYMIITRRDMPGPESQCVGRQGRGISSMLLSQPPCVALEATIWEERDETRDYVGRTSSLREPNIRSDDGLTIGYVHQRVGEMFREYRDVAAIKLTTV